MNVLSVVWEKSLKAAPRRVENEEEDEEILLPLTLLATSNSLQRPNSLNVAKLIH